MLNKLRIFAFILIVSLGWSACKNGDEPASGNSTFTINDSKVGKILYTLCEISPLPKEIVFEIHFDYKDEGLTSFVFAVPSITSISQLKNGIDLTDDVVIYKFYSTTGIMIGYQHYQVVDGSLKVKKVDDNVVILKFSNFVFLREFGNKEQTFKVNGNVIYSINN